MVNHTSFKTYIINKDVPFKNKLQQLHSLYLDSTHSHINALML